MFDPQRIEDAVKRHRPKLVAVVQGDTSTTMAQPLDAIGRICREHDALIYVDATASVAGMPLETDAWRLDAVSAGLQKCLSGPPGIAPLTFNERVEAVVRARKHVEQGIRPEDYKESAGRIIQSNYFDLSMLMDYWSESRLNHHTEATSMLYAARECARLALAEGLENRFERHARASRAMTAGLRAMGLELFGDQAHKMPNVTGVYIPEGVPGGRRAPSVARRLRPGDRDLVRPAARQDLADRHDGLRLPPGQRDDLPRGARSDPAPLRPRQRAGRRGRGRARGLGRRVGRAGDGRGGPH